MTAIETCYISTGCNRTPHCADWGLNGLICFGSCRSVTVYQPEEETKSAKILQTHVHHKDRVNCVTWIKKLPVSESNAVGLVSGSVDNTAIVWKYMDGKLKPAATLKNHTGPVNGVAAMCLQTSTVGMTTYVATSSADSTVNLWKQENEGDFQLLQTHKFGTGFVLDLSFTVIPDTNVPMLACGCDDQKIHIFIEQSEKFVRIMSLQGHEDWIRAIDFTIDDTGDIILASAAQDFFIRIWRFSRRSVEDNIVKTVKELSLDEEIKMKENTFQFKIGEETVVYAVSLESVLSGHENWIYSVKWQPSVNSGSGWHQPMHLLSASMDKTMILWKPDKESGVWVEEVRVGEVGGNTLGFYGGMFSPDGLSIMAHGYQGAFHHWAFTKSKGTWEPQVTASGHFDVVCDVEWDKGGGQYLVSLSVDQTTRLHAPWKQSNGQADWYEIARPQVHGYDLQCLALINRYKFASGADEKVIRSFDAPKNFIENFCSICGISLEAELKKEEAQNRPAGASVPALGLSNKAVYSGDVEKINSNIEQHPNDQYPEVYFTPVALQTPPTEEHLLQNTLWPETQKLYGHGYEIFALACDTEGKILASSCKASKVDFAGVILWDTTTWNQICTLEGHTLTVTQMAFSHNGNYLLTVSRDRTWMLYRKRDENSQNESLFTRISGTNKSNTAHTRIIWSCAWSHDDKYFLTASRDKKVMVWLRPDLSSGDILLKPQSVIDVGDAATAIHLPPVACYADKYLISIGVENGEILLYSWKPSDNQGDWTLITKLDQQLSHHLTVKKLRFRPVLDNKTIQLASCSADHSVKIFKICL
ncbi:elongator complex protein 2-like [Mytilus galloprovincialis]|uniref:elongator complex protein 2-like n=1 Tax=Mytilus galloprovincialis TaxID=29158 RepID=UPI003F7C63D6